VVEAARSGAEWAWGLLVSAVDGTLHAYLRRQGGIEVDDLVSETWLHVARGIAGFQGDEAAFRSWVFTIAHHRLIDERRRIGRRRADCVEQHTLDQAAPESPSAEAEALERLCDEELQRLLGMLSPAQREVIVLRFLAGFGPTEIGSIIGKDPNAVRALQRRGLKRLDKILRQSGTFFL
jgi:RNA polymerase sigma-70 factor (ECF subfamily)